MSRLSDSLFRDVVERSPAGVYVIGKGGKTFVYVNKAMADMFGYSADEIVGELGPLDLAHPEDRDFVAENVAKCMRGEVESVRFRFRGVKKSGEIIWCKVYVSVVEGKHERLIAGTLLDITWQVKSEEELAEKERFYRALFEGTNDGIYVMDENVFVDCNKKGIELFGCSKKEDFVGHAPYEFSPEFQPDGNSSKEKALEYIRKALDGKPQRFYWKHKRKDGSLFDAEVSLQRIEIEGRVVLRAVVRDITERLRLEREIKEREELYRDLVEKSGIAIAIVDHNDRITYFNERLCEISGYSHQELREKFFKDIVHPDDRDRLKSYYVPGLKGDLVPSPKEFEFRIIRKDGDVSYIGAGVSPIVAEGKARGYRLYLTDLTEVKKLREQFFMSQKMEAIGRLAGGIAHDFNNVLTIILGRCELALQKSEDKDFLVSSIKTIKGAADRASSLTRHLLAFSRRQMMEPMPVNLNDVITGMKDMIGSLLGEDIKLEFALSEDLGTVEVDPSLMEHAIINLIVNSCDAMPSGGVLTIETSNVFLDKEYAEKHVGVSPGHYVLLAVSDTGIGMDEEVRSRVFEPFFTTKRGGTGLGLSMVYGTVKQSGGYIWCYSEPGRGTTFKIYFPRVEEGKKEVEEKGEIEAVPEPSAPCSVMVVEDDPAVRDVTVSFLESAGYKVYDVEKADDALKLLKEKKDEICLLLTDVVMPGMSGGDLAKEAIKIKPDIKVLFMSGYTDNVIVHHGVKDRGVHFIQKPFSRGNLLKKVEEVMKSSSSGGVRHRRLT